MVQMHMMIVNYGCGTCRSKPCANSFAPMFFFCYSSRKETTTSSSDTCATRTRIKTGSGNVLIKRPVTSQLLQIVPKKSVETKKTIGVSSPDHERTSCSTNVSVDDASKISQDAPKDATTNSGDPFPFTPSKVLHQIL